MGAHDLNMFAAHISSISLFLWLSPCQDFPGSHVTGVDLSPYFVAVARYNKRQMEEEQVRERNVHHG